MAALRRHYAEALADLKRHYKLVILSNVDRQNFAGSNKKLAVAFDAICTAEDIGSYKPNPKNFEYLIARVRELGHDKSEILHTAQSLYHDHAPAEALGLARCWINRRGDKGMGSGATNPVARMPKLDFEFPTLAAMAEAHEAATNGRSKHPHDITHLHARTIGVCGNNAMHLSPRCACSR